MIRAVLDTNVIVSGVISQAGPPGQLLRGALETGMFLLMTSPMLLEEVAAILWEENIRKYHRWHQDQLLAFLARLHRHSQVTPGQLQVQVIAGDPDDNAVLARAMEGDAAYIVTGDRDLLHLGVYEGIKIVTPAQFLRTLTEHQD
jgi:putative PIN family toxin of toxin-antitoxin system